MARSPPRLATVLSLSIGNRHYVWYSGTDGKLYVCWWGGSSYLNGSFTPANCAAPNTVSYDNY